MRETLFIRLPATADANAEYAIGSADAPRSLLGRSAPLPEVLGLAPGRRLVVLVPAADIRLASVTVPARQPQKVLQAAPYLLEEQLAEDVEDLHFALGPRQADGSNPIAVVTRARMERWLTPFREQGLRPEVLCPEMLALPWEADPPRWSALAEPALVTVRNGEFSGFCCAPEDLVSFLELADPDRTHALRLLIAGESADYSGLDWPLELLPGFGSAVEAVALNYRPEASINLLQGSYSQRRDLQKLWAPWRLPAALLVAWLLIGALAYGIDSWRLQREVSAQEAANIGRFQQLFPSESRIVDLQIQLEQQTAALKSGGRDSGLFALLDVLSQALSENSGVQLQGMQYRDGALFLSMTGADLQVVEKLRSWFTPQRPARLEVQSADAGAEGVQIRLKLSPA